MHTETNLLPTQSTSHVTFAIDAHSANKDQRTGVENYAFHLIQEMKKHPLQEGERVFLYSYKPLSGGLELLPKGWYSQVLTWPPRRGWMSLRVAWELRRSKPDVFFVPSQGLPRWGGKMVTTVHDFGFRMLKKVYDPADLKRQKNVDRRLKRASHFLAVSDTTKKDLMHFHKTPEEKITVTTLAVDTSVFKRLDPGHVRSVLQKHRLGQRFFLTVGRLEKKKNIVNLIRAFNQFKQNRGTGDPYELVLVGKPGFGYDEIKNHIDHSDFKGEIRELGFVSDEDVAALMNAATAYLFPSWFEGFGIPSIEAMVTETPLIVADLPVHHEIIGDNAVFVDPAVPEQWSRAMASLVQDQQRQQDLKEKGVQHAQLYSWNATAQKTWEVLRGLV